VIPFALGMLALEELRKWMMHRIVAKKNAPGRQGH